MQNDDKRLVELIETLLGYTQHTDTCEFEGPAERFCECGLNDTVSDIGEEMTRRGWWEPAKETKGVQ